jgi:hypothetical protein
MIPPIQGIQFEDEKPALLKIVTDRKVNSELARRFKTLKEEAKPQMLLK